MVTRRAAWRTGSHHRPQHTTKEGSVGPNTSFVPFGVSTCIVAKRLNGLKFNAGDLFSPFFCVSLLEYEKGGGCTPQLVRGPACQTPSVQGCSHSITKMVHSRQVHNVGNLEIQWCDFISRCGRELEL